MKSLVSIIIVGIWRFCCNTSSVYFLFYLFTASEYTVKINGGMARMEKENADFISHTQIILYIWTIGLKHLIHRSFHLKKILLRSNICSSHLDYCAKTIQSYYSNLSVCTCSIMNRIWPCVTYSTNNWNYASLHRI